jgi:hypothetical protein
MSAAQAISLPPGMGRDLSELRSESGPLRASDALRRGGRLPNSNPALQALTTDA